MAFACRGVRLGYLLALFMALALPGTGRATGAGFDHYLLALTWMPSFCEVEGDAREDARCTPEAAHGWMVHGLWPQGLGGTWPEFCRTRHRNPTRRETAAQSDLFGASGAAWHQWNKHGRCSGLTAEDYFTLTRAAESALTLPHDIAPESALIAPQAVEAAVIASNPNLREDMMVTVCRRDLITEVRLCLTRDLQPRACDAELHRRACNRPDARLPPLR